MSHFYLDGKPYYTVKDAKGKDRATTLRDARKVGAVIGVTSIIGQLDKPQLNSWKLRRLLELLEMYPNLCSGIINNNHKSPKWKDQILGMSENRNSSFSKEGNRVHDLLENYYTDGTIEPEDEDLIYPVVKAIEEKFGVGKYEAEKSFSHDDGFGGCIDLVLHTPEGKIIIDFKTKNKADITKADCREDYMMQLAAYRKAVLLEKVTVKGCANVLISLVNVGEVFIYEWPEEQIDKGEEMFYNLLGYWKLANNYKRE